MNYEKFRFLFLMGRKLLWPFQLRKLTNYAKYRLMVPFVRKWGPDKLVFSPPNIIIAVTARCNKKCDFCYFGGELNGDDAYQLELSYEKFLHIINHPLIVNSLRIAFSGGEPFLNKDLFRMVREARSRGHIASVITNGKLLRKRAAELMDNPPDFLTVTYNPEDQAQLADALSLFAGNITVKLDFVLSKSRLAEVENFLKMAVVNKVRIVDIENMTINPTIDSKEQPLREDDMEFQQLKSNLNKKYGKHVLINWRKLLPGAGEKKISKCRVFWHSLHVDAKGRISPCCQWPLRTYQDDIFANSHAWNSELMISLRKLFRNGSMHDYCKGCSAFYEDYLGI
jgi:MoaA/NifB/PqqE/SkfB family radical SAM enzyme